MIRNYFEEYAQSLVSISIPAGIAECRERGTHLFHIAIDTNIVDNEEKLKELIEYINDIFKGTVSGFTYGTHDFDSISFLRLSIILNLKHSLDLSRIFDSANKVSKDVSNDFTIQELLNMPIYFREVDLNTRKSKVYSISCIAATNDGPDGKWRLNLFKDIHQYRKYKNWLKKTSDKECELITRID